MTLAELIKAIFTETVHDVEVEKAARIQGDQNNRPLENTAYYSVNSEEHE